MDRYYGASIEKYDNWKVWSSSGRIDDIYRLVKQSGGDFWGIEQRGWTLTILCLNRS